MSNTDRVVVLVDMDCFYCQVEENLNPLLKGKPLAVVQYNAWKGGGIIAVNYPARAKGVTRHMRGDEAKQKCPEIELARVPNVRGKADLTKYREAGKLVAKVLQKFTPLLERASVDEAYLDITEAVKQRMEVATKEINLSDIKNTHIAGAEVMDFIYNLYNSGVCCESNLRLAFGAVLVEEIRSAVFVETGYTCSAGIAHNKILAKLACGLHKPNQQTILPQDNVPEIYKSLPIHKIRSLGGKFGETLSENLGIKYMSELLKFTEKELTKYYDEKTVNWLYNIARGINMDPVNTRLVAKSIACCKKFPGKSALIQPDSVEHWLKEIASEIVERLSKDFEENNRKAKQLVVSYSQGTSNGDIAASRTISLRSYDLSKIVKDAFDLIKKNCLNASGNLCIKYLGLSAGKFEDYKKVNEITTFFKIQPTLRKSDDAGNYSDTTVDLQEDESNLNFFGETGNGSIKDTASDCDSITNELNMHNNSGNNSGHDNDPSFFLNYVDPTKPNYQSPVKRDFDTSRIFDDLSNDDCISTDSLPDNTEASTSYVDKPSDVISSICKECNKKILETEMVSHRDYHFALQIVREESKLYKIAQPSQNKTNLKSASKKRKISEIHKNSLDKFLQSDFKNSSSETKRELCPECNKHIDSSNFSNHLDYHAAKKLHMEINPVYSITATPTNITQTKKKKENTVHNTKSIAQFFKPTS